MTPTGELTDRISIYERAVERDSFGATSEAWRLVASRWAKIEAAGGSEVWVAGGPRPDVSHTITLRYLEGITPRHQVRQGERVFSIESAIDPDNQGEELILAVKEVV